MEKVKVLKLEMRYQIIQKALAALKKAIDDYNTLQNQEYFIHLRNSKIQSFEFCVDTMWKFIRAYIVEKIGTTLEVGPKPTFRACFKAGLASETQVKQLLEMVDARNLSSHTYQEEIAINLDEKIEMYYQLMSKLLEYIGSKL